MSGFAAERCFVSHKGFHLEFKSLEDAEGFYSQGLKLGNRVEIHGRMVIMLTSKYLRDNASK